MAGILPTLGRIGLGISTGGLSEVVPPLINTIGGGAGVHVPTAAEAVDAIGGIKPDNINIKGLGDTTRDKNIQGYTLSPDVLAAYTAIGNTQYTPRTVAAPGFSVGDIASQYAVTPQQVAPTFQSQVQTNQDGSRQQQVGGQQLDEASRLRSIIGGSLTPADVDNQALLRQAQALQLSAASTARGGTDQRQTVQRDAAGNVVTLGTNNVAVLAAQRAQEQADARAQLSQVLGQNQQQSALWQGATYNIANADAIRQAQAASANQQAGTTAAIANKGAVVSATGVDQNGQATITNANDTAGERSYVDETGRVVSAGQGKNAVEGVGITSDAATVEAQQRAKALQLEEQRRRLEYEKAKAAAAIQKTSAAVGAVGQVVGVVAGGA